MQIWLKKMIFKYLTGLILFIVTSVLYADVSVKNNTKDVKVIDNTPASQAAESTKPDIEYSNKQNVRPAEKRWRLYAEQWELTRSGESIMSLPVLKEVTAAWLQEQHKVIEVQYPGGEEGEFWVHELMDWLVSLGIPSSKMLSVPGSGADDVINFTLVK